MTETAPLAGMSSDQDSLLQAPEPNKAAAAMPSSSATYNNSNHHGDKPASSSSSSWHQLVPWEEVKLQCQLAGPMVVVNVLQMAIQLISIMFVGHLGELALSSSSIAVSVTNVTGMCLMMGLASGLETLCGQAYGAKQYRMLGIYLQSGLLVSNLTAIAMSFVYANMNKILLVLGQEPNISKEAGQYSAWLIPLLFAYASVQQLTRFLQTQSLVVPMVACSCAGILCHVPLCWLLVYKTGLGSKGAAISASVSGWVNVALLSFYVRFSTRCQKTRAPLSWEAFRHMKSYIKLAIPSAAMVCLEWWCYEILVLLSGLLPDPELQASTLSICLNTANLTFMLPFGLGAAASTRVSNELGAGRPQEARAAVRVAMILDVMQACFVSVMVLSLRNVLGRVYSSDYEVIKSVAAILPLLAVSSILDSLQAVISGAVRGCGLQRLGAFINLGSFYIVGLPIGALLGFKTNLQAKGLWIGVICGPAVQVLSLGTIIRAADWDKEASNARLRVHSDVSSRDPLLLH